MSSAVIGLLIVAVLAWLLLCALRCSLAIAERMIDR